MGDISSFSHTTRERPVEMFGQQASESSIQIKRIDVASRALDTLRVQAQALGMHRLALDFRLRERLHRSRLPGLRGYGAIEGNELLGFTYGLSSENSEWWRRYTVPHLRDSGNKGWTEGTFLVCELHVLPSYQHRGLGTQLISELCAHAVEPRSVLSTPHGPTPARQLYKFLGYRDLVEKVSFPGVREPFSLMGAELPLAARIILAESGVDGADSH
ncbi:GNAT family N-acetyltransferase [Streptomyces wuyuanensis]|uniref:GNAT family N-acetyltransferase n=1 Tax=Streptomyces wuyuanensis TaxID=1196353 RepID=UPI0034126C74